ncbi:MAG: siderophore-interacting protein [Azospirillaceae bacterium]|nr:siderophore-interacting protein [Azospirillaceae bacterium]
MESPDALIGAGELEPQPGRVAQTLRRWLMRTARVAAVESLSPYFRRVRLEGEELVDAAWEQGQKIQVAMGTGLSARTYTPISWDNDRGATDLLIFTHGDGPGSRWASRLRAGAACQFMGPRRSLDLVGFGTPLTLFGFGTPLTLFGDETSFALAVSLRATLGGGLNSVFEVSDKVEAQSVLDAVGLGGAALVERRPDDGHLEAATAALWRFADHGARFVLTGKAQSIQQANRALRAGGVAPSRIKAKAYWAPGKTGLD